MELRIFTLKFNPVIDSFDDEIIRDFIKDKEILMVKDHFFVKSENPYLVIVITYNLVRPDICESKKVYKGKRDELWRELITEKEMPLFNTLRNWRSERCKKDGVPPYVICTNRQLAEIALNRPQSLSVLNQTKGFGKAKITKYGDELLKILSESNTKVEQNEK